MNLFASRCRIDVHLAAERVAEALISAPRLAPAAGLRLQAHQGDVRFFVRWLVRGHPTQRLDVDGVPSERRTDAPGENFR
jgi:hypothetical protein